MKTPLRLLLALCCAQLACRQAQSRKIDAPEPPVAVNFAGQVPDRPVPGSCLPHTRPQDKAAPDAKSLKCVMSSDNWGWINQGAECVAPREKQADRKQPPASSRSRLPAQLAYIVVVATSVTTAIWATRRLLRWWWTRKFIRPETPFTRLLGHILLDNTDGSMQYAATGDVLTDDALTAIYVSSAKLEEIFAKHNIPPVLDHLKLAHKRCAEKNQKFNVVYVSVDSAASSGLDHFKNMNWFAVPFGHRSRILSVLKTLRITNLPSIVLINGKGELVNDRGYSAVRLAPDGFPWQPKKWQDVLGTLFKNPRNEPVSRSHFDGKIVGLYFGASWCTPCATFGPALAKLQKTVSEAGKPFEVVYVCVDNKNDKLQVGRESNFFYIPPEDKTRVQELIEHFRITTLPSLVLLDMDAGTVINDNASHIPVDDPEGKFFPWALPRVIDVKSSIRGLSENIAVVAFTENAAAETQENIHATLLAAADKHRVAGAEASRSPIKMPPRKLQFYHARDVSKNGLILRKLLQMPPPSADDAPTVHLVLVDLADGKFYKTSTAVQLFGPEFVDRFLHSCAHSLLKPHTINIQKSFA